MWFWLYFLMFIEFMSVIFSFWYLMTYLQVKFYSSKMPQLFRAPLHHVTTNSMWHYNLVYHLQEYGLCLKLWWKFCSQLLMLVFWTKVENTSYFQMHCGLLYWLVGYLGRINISTYFWQPCGRGFFYHELKKFVVHMICDTFWRFFYTPLFLHALIGKKGHNMLILMFDLRLRACDLLSHF